MKNYIKIFLIIFVILIIVILIDTAQAKVFNNRPLIKVTEDYNSGNVDKKDKGIFVYTYVFSDETKKTVFRWEKYAPPIKESVNLYINNNDSFNSVDNINYENNNRDEVGSVMENAININVIINNQKYNAIIENNETAKSFIDQLPQEFNMKELNGNEKYVYMDSVLPTNSINPKHIEKGDIMLYGSDCLVIFYKSFETNYSYTKIGHIDNLPDLGINNITVKFEK